MNGKEGSFGIKISSSAKDKLPETKNKFKDWMYTIWEFAKEDTSRVTFPLKVGLAVLLVSLLILFQAPYQVFGTSIIWSILTVVIMFEYTVGMCIYIYILQKKIIIYFRKNYCLTTRRSTYTRKNE